MSSLNPITIDEYLASAPKDIAVLKRLRRMGWFALFLHLLRVTYGIVKVSSVWRLARKARGRNEVEVVIDHVGDVDVNGEIYTEDVWDFAPSSSWKTYQTFKIKR